MIEATKSVWTNTVGNIKLQFEDIATSNTVPFVFGELRSDYYGLEKIKLNKEDTVIDVGGNVGMFSIYVKKKFGCRVISFEPVLMNYEQFKKNIILNGLSLSDIELHNTAITDIEGGEISIGTPLHNTGGSSEFYKCDNMLSCRTETLSKYITKDCKYLKIDAEGAEYKIIPNILDTINTFSYIGIEYHRFNSLQNPLELHNLLKSTFKGDIFCEEPKI